MFIMYSWEKNETETPVRLEFREGEGYEKVEKAISRSMNDTRSYHRGSLLESRRRFARRRRDAWRLNQ